MLSLRYPENKQLTAWSHWLNGGSKDPGSADWSDALNITTMLMTMVKQYAEVCKQVIN